MVVHLHAKGHAKHEGFKSTYMSEKARNKEYTSVADLHSKILDARPPPRGSKFFQFHAVFGKFWQNRMLAPPPGELAPPPGGNPGSANAHCAN